MFMSNLTKDYGDWGTTVIDITNPDVWYLIIAVIFIIVVIYLIYNAIK